MIQRAIGAVGRVVSGQGLRQRAMRGSAWTIVGFGTSQAIRLASNLILTRILFPEAFGLMALITVFMVGLAMFSDLGIGTSVKQNARGDDPAFLRTAWTLQAIRGLILWLGTCLLAWPVSIFYGEPRLAEMLPVAGLSLLIAGFNPIAFETAHRHLRLGRETLLDLASQILSLGVMIGLAWVTQSVWSLVIGAVAGSGIKLALGFAVFPGDTSRPHWERAAVSQLVGFGKWIFLATAFGFVVVQGDRLILGTYLTLAQLGVYNIGYFLASFPIHLAAALVVRLLIPLYREKPPSASPENFRKIRKVRFALTGFIMTMLIAMAVAGIAIVDVLYDDRYAAAGAAIVLVSCAQLPYVIGMTYDQAALAAGDSRGFAVVIGAKAAAMIGFMVAGAEIGGLAGALAGQGLSHVVTHPAVIWLARRHRAWDGLHDCTFAALGTLLAAAVLWLHLDAVLLFARQ